MAKIANSPRKGLFKEVELCITSKLDVRSSSFHPIDPVLACGLFKGDVAILKKNHSFPLTTWEIERKFQCENSALSLKWNTSGTKLAAGCSDGNVIVWCYPSGERRIFQINGRSICPTIVWNLLNSDVLASFYKSADCKKVSIFDAATDKSFELKSNKNVSCVEWISHNRLICGYDNGTAEISEIELSDQSTSKLIKKLLVSSRLSHTLDPYSLSEGDIGYQISSIAWNEELQLLASSSEDSWIKIWSMEKEDPIRMMQSSSSCCHLVWGLANGIMEKPYLAGGLENGSILIWSPLEKNLQPSLFFDGHSHKLHQVLFSNNGQFLASTDYEGKLVIWSTENWDMIYTLPSSKLHHPHTMSWNATNSNLGISKRNEGKQFKLIEYVVPKTCCATCTKTSHNMKHCGRCHSICYCSRECQRSHWPLHKAVCH